MTQVQDIQKVPYVIMEHDDDGQPSSAPGDTATVTVDHPEACDVVPDATPVVAGAIQTGFFVPKQDVIKGGTITLPLTVTGTSHIVHADGSAGPPDATTQFAAVSGPPSSQSLAVGTPVNQ